MQAAGGRAGEVVEVDAGTRCAAPRARVRARRRGRTATRGSPGESELPCAVAARSRRRFGSSDPGATSSGTRWCSISTSACLMTCAPRDPLGPEQQVGRDRPAGATSAMISGSRSIEPGELLVEPGAGVVAVDQRVGELAASARRSVVATPRSTRLRRPRRRFQRAITLVKALSSTGSWYSSGPDDAVDVGAPVGVDARSGTPSSGPSRRGALGRGPRRERLVARPVDVAARRPRDVGDDVLLELAGADRHEPPAVVARGRRRDVAARRRPTPTGTARPRRPSAARGLARGGKPADAGTRASRGRPRDASPPGTGSTKMSRPRTRGRGRPGRVSPRAPTAASPPSATEPSGGTARTARTLQLVVALDDDVRGSPALAPTLLRCSHEQPVESMSTRGRESVECVFRVRDARSVDDVARNTVEHAVVELVVGRDDPPPSPASSRSHSTPFAAPSSISASTVVSGRADSSCSGRPRARRTVVPGRASDVKSRASSSASRPTR